MVYPNTLKGIILCGPGYSQLYKLEKNTYTMLCIPCWNELSSTHQGTADVKDHCASNVKEIQPLLQFETICWHPSRILHVKWVRCLLCRLRLWSLFCPHLLLVNLDFKFNFSKIYYKLHFVILKSSASCGDFFRWKKENKTKAIHTEMFKLHVLPLFEKKTWRKIHPCKVRTTLDDTNRQ